MNLIPIKQRHSTNAFLFILSNFFERTGYYGLRSILVLFMMNGPLQLKQESAFEIYGWLMGGMVLSQLIGAALGDWIFGNKPIMIFGAFLQALGAFLICTGNLTSLYIAIGCITIGGGFYKPNLVSCFGREYNNKVVLNDGGFSYMYFFINLGAIVGALLVGTLGDGNFTIGFAIAGTFLLLSAITPLLIRDEEIESNGFVTSSHWNYNAIVLVILSASVFWFLFDLIFATVFSNESSMPQLIYGISFEQMQTYINSFISLFIGIIFAVIWSNYSMNSFFKMAFGFLCSGAAVVLLYVNHNLMPEGSGFMLLGSIFSLSLAEIFIGPFLYSLLNQNVPSKYLATFVAVSLLCIHGLNKLSTFLSSSIADKPMLTFVLCAIVFIVLGVVTLLFGIKSQRSMHHQEEKFVMDLDQEINKIEG